MVQENERYESGRIKGRKNKEDTIKFLKEINDEQDR